MRLPLALVLLVALSLAAPAGAADLELGLEAGTGYTSNVFSQVTDPRDDFLGTIGPRIRMMDEVGAFTWAVRYWPTYERYLDIGEADGWNHDVDARASWAPSERTALRLTQRYVNTGDVNQIFTQDRLPDATVETGLEFGRDQLESNSTSLGLDHSLARRHGVGLTIARTNSTFARELESESAVTAVSGSYLYTWSPRTRVGLSLSGTEQEVTTDGRDARPTRYYNASLQWQHAFEPTLTLNATVGPTLVDQDRLEPPTVLALQRYPASPFVAPNGATVGLPTRASSCPRNGRGELFFSGECESLGLEVIPVVVTNPLAFEGQVDAQRIGGTPATGQDLTYFANVDLTKRWRNFTLTLSYGRDASTTSEVSGIVRDNLSGYVTWIPSATWTVGFYTYYERRELPTSTLGAELILQPAVVAGIADVAEVAGFRIITQERDLEVNDYFGGIYVNYTLSRSTKLYFNFTYQYEELQTEFERAVAEANHWDRFYASFGVTYTFDRIHLPF